MSVPLQCCPHNAEKGNEHEQVQKSIACHMALSIPLGLGTEVPLSHVAGSDRQRGSKVHDDVLSATRMRDCGDECTGRSRAHVGEGAAEAVDLGVDGCPERTYRDSIVQCISEFAKEAVLG